MLGEGFSSKLSPWLALGCISPRRIWAEAGSATAVMKEPN